MDVHQFGIQHVITDAIHDVAGTDVCLEPIQVKSKCFGVAEEIIDLECVLPLEQIGSVVEEPPLCGRSLACVGCDK